MGETVDHVCVSISIASAPSLPNYDDLSQKSTDSLHFFHFLHAVFDLYICIFVSSHPSPLYVCVCVFVCVCVCVCVCVSQWKNGARRMASTTSDTGDRDHLCTKTDLTCTFALNRFYCIYLALGSEFCTLVLDGGVKLLCSFQERRLKSECTITAMLRWKRSSFAIFKIYLGRLLRQCRTTPALNMFLSVSTPAKQRKW